MALKPDVCLVTGGRDFLDREFVYATMDAVHQSTKFRVLVHGAARGLDRLADDWARRRALAVRPYPISSADWDRLGKSAGRHRNRQMFDENDPGVVVVFPGDQGTAHAAGIAEGIKARHPELVLVRADRVYEKREEEPRLVNIRTDTKAWITDPRFYSVGRDGPFGNPFVIGRDGDRAEVIRRYRDWVATQPDLVARIRRDLKGKVLGCYCTPEPCHGDVILEILDGRWPPPRGVLRVATEEGSCKCQGFYQPIDCPVHCHVLAYCDGSNSLKDGSAGLGVVLFYADGRTRQIAAACGPATNIVAELFAIERVLREVSPQHPLTIRTDSLWSIEALTNTTWNITKNTELVQHIKNILTDRKVLFEHVKGHAGEPGNEAADRLASIGRKEDQACRVLKNES